MTRESVVVGGILKGRRCVSLRMLTHFVHPGWVLGPGLVLCRRGRCGPRRVDYNVSGSNRLSWTLAWEVVRHIPPGTVIHTSSVPRGAVITIPSTCVSILTFAIPVGMAVSRSGGQRFALGTVAVTEVWSRR